MHCLESRRALLADTRPRTPAHRAHLAACPQCAQLAASLDTLGRTLEAAAALPVPDALSDRILLTQRGLPVARYVIAAALALATLFIGMIMGESIEDGVGARAVYAVSPTHPAVAAIAEVAAEDPLPADALEANSAALERGLERLGLALEEPAAARHVGKCHIEGTRACEHIVLTTRGAHANVMLVPDYPFSERIVVADRHLVALASPAGTGGYIVVAESSSAAHRVEKLLVKRPA